MGTERQVQTLSYAVRPGVVLKYLGHLGFALAVLSAVILAVSLLSGEYNLALRYGLVVAVFAAFGVLALKLGAPAAIQENEALSITALVFIITPLLMAHPMMAAGLTFTDALFEAVSAVTTTGLSTLPTVEGKPATFLFSRAWLQWSGGLGIVVLSVALLIGPSAVARRLALTETDISDMAASTRSHARRVFTVYLFLTAFGVAVLWLLGTSPFDAVLNALAAVSTGGFSSHDGGIAEVGGYGVQAAVIMLSLLGAMPLALYHRVLRKGIGELSVHVEARGLIAFCLISTGLIFFFMTISDGMDMGQAMRHAPLMAFSAQTTTGFSTLDVSSLSQASKLALIISMAVGGNVGSTAGGIKVFRILIMLRLMQLAVRRTFLPGHAVVSPQFGGHKLEGEEVERALVLVLLFSVVMLVSWMPFVAMGYDPLDSLFEVVSATGTVGLSAGISAPGLPAFLKGVLCMDMLMGRLEMVAILVILYPRTWIGRRVEP